MRFPNAHAAPSEPLIRPVGTELPLRLLQIRHQIRNGNNLQPPLPRKLDTLLPPQHPSPDPNRPPRHLLPIIHDLADRRSGPLPRQPTKVLHRSLRVPWLSLTPPSRALRGSTCPGLRNEAAVASLSASVLSASARSCAEMPVVTDGSAASHGDGYAVPRASWFWATICGSSRAVACGARMGAQMSPEEWRIMKAMFSGVASSAARIRSASFSREGSSRTTRNSPSPGGVLESFGGGFERGEGRAGLTY